MKKATSAITILAITMVILGSFFFGVSTAKADDNYAIEHVSQRVEVMYNGYVFMNVTIRLNIPAGQALDAFLIGFPGVYGQNVLRCIAYSGTERFDVALDVPFDNRMGFYGAKIEFPHGAPEVFAVEFILSNDLLLQYAQYPNYYFLSFPEYPSLAKNAAVCNVSVVLPAGAMYVDGTIENLTYSQESLQEFTHSIAELVFNLTRSEQLQIVDITDLKRDIKINEFGKIECADTYYMTNKADKSLEFFEVFLPLNASSPTAEDLLGRRMSTPTPQGTNRYRISFNLPVEKGQPTGFTVRYSLPSDYLEQRDGANHALSLLLFSHINYYINQFSASFSLPEGAAVLGIENNLADNVHGLTRSVFRESVTVSRQGVTASDNLSIGIVYAYNSLWSSFRPTIWILTLTLLGCVVVLAWRKPKGPVRAVVPAVAAKLRPEHLKSFVDAYTEKIRIFSELESLEARVRKGKIPRRRYKVRRKTLETRLSTLDRTLAEFREKTRAVGGLYSDLMRQLEVAETEISEAQANVRSIEARHNRGELSLGAYRKLQTDYERRKQNAETTIKGILLRLREEIH